MIISAHKLNKLIKFNVLSTFVLSMIAVSTSFIFTLSEKGSVPHNNDVNVVTIANETYDAVVCPTGSTDATCTHFGASGMQEAINNAPDRTKDNPYKVFIKNGEYTGFVPLVFSKPGVSGGTRTFYTLFDINSKSINITGESKDTTIINGQDQSSTIFNINDSFVKFDNLKATNTKNILFTDSSLDFNTGCKKNDSSICFDATGSFVRATSSSQNFSSEVIINNVNNYKTVDFLYILSYVNNSKFTIKNSVAHSNRELGLGVHGNNTIDIIASEFISISDGYINYNPISISDSSVVSFTNSIIFWQNVPASSCLNLYDNAIARITNSFFSNCMTNVVTLNNNSKAYINNSILQSVNYYGVRANDTSSAEVKFSFLYQAGQGATRGAVTLISPPLNSNYTDDPQIVFATNDYYNPNSFNPLTISRSRNTGDPAILNVDGTRSHIGVAGGPYACLLRSYFPGCGISPTPITTPTIISSPTVAVSPSTTPVVSPSTNMEADLNLDGQINLLDIILLLGIIFN